MPRFDGSGPRSQGPMTGRGEGYCVIRLPERGRPAYGYAGWQGKPVRLGTLPTEPDSRFTRSPSPATQRGRALRRGRGQRHAQW